MKRWMTVGEIEACRRIGRDAGCQSVSIGTVELDALCDTALLAASRKIFGYWDVFNQALYKDPGEAEKARVGGNEVVTLYEAPGPASSSRRANDTQVGGTHYMKHGQFQPWDAWWLWKLNAFQGAIIKYVTRYRDKGKPMEDLEKAKHYLEKLIECEREDRRNGEIRVSNEGVRIGGGGGGGGCDGSSATS